MKKYSMLIYHQAFRDFLKDLQKVGVVDIVDRGIAPDDETNCEIQRVQQFDRVIKILQSKLEKDSPEVTDLMPGKILKIVLQTQSEIDDLKQKIIVLEKHLKNVKPWGNFNPEIIDKLKDEGLGLRFFAVSQRKFNDKWLSDYNLEIISHVEGQIFFVIIQQSDEKMEIDADEVKAPERSAPDIQKEIEDYNAQIVSANNYLGEHAQAYLPRVIQARSETENRISFDHVVKNANSESEDKLKIIEGWVPKSKMPELEAFLDENGIFYLAADPVKDEKVPILLNNGKFSRLFEPIGKLYSLPKYGELDLIPFFAPFFMLFFGFCLGDAGYGLLFLIATTLLKPRMKPDMKRIMTLMQWLGGSTIIFGIITGTFFGMNLIELTDQGKISWLVDVREYMLDSSKMFYFALILGGIQIIYGMFIKAANQARQYGFKYALSTIGWIVLILGNIFLFALSGVISSQINTVMLYIVFAISGVLILFLNNPEKNIFVNFGGGLWDVYSVVTGVMGDLLSYIRLFALGVSSAILGYVFNDLAIQMSGSIPVLSQLIFVVILLVGHGLNIFMATLGAFVHPMRLTFVEFYKNAGFQGGGKAYNPFRHKEAG
ncbi:MAG: hypothetical protein K9H16_02270 [Bacteroidales bacterium]|nr:hypothetical protein [Bacteroidales bacterium]